MTVLETFREFGIVEPHRSGSRGVHRLTPRGHGRCLGRALRLDGSPRKAAAFLLTYVGLAALVVVAWAVAPVLSFISFLAISIYHFGR